MNILKATSLILPISKSIVFLLPLFFLWSCQQDDDQGELPGDPTAFDSFLLKDRDDIISINRIQGEEIVRLTEFEIELNARYTYDGCCNLAMIEKEGETLYVFDQLGNLVAEEELPTMTEIISIFTDGANVFIGGRDDGAKFMQYNLNTGTWYMPHTPDWLTSWKNIDDFVIQGAQLIAIDNFVSPKYLLYYDLEGDEEVTYTGDFELNFLSPNEVIHKGEISADYLGVLGSLYPGYSTNHDYIMVLQLDKMEEFFVLASKRFGPEPDFAYKFFVDFLIHENSIIFANRVEGIGRLELREEFFSESTNLQDGTYELFEPYLEDYITLPGQATELTATPDERFYIASYTESEGVYGHLVLEF